MPDSFDLNRFRLRDFSWDDLPGLMEIGNLIYADEPSTLADWEHWERTYPQGNPRRRYVAEMDDGQVVALGACLRPFWMSTPNAYLLDIMVHPDFRQRGIGHTLYAAVAPFAGEQGAERLWASCREDWPDAISFLEHLGFARIGIRFESALDLQDFDEAPFRPVVARAEAAGYRISTLTAERAVNPDAERQLYDLQVTAMADVPFPGGARPEMTYENWRSQMLEGPTNDPDGIFIAVAGDRYVGLTALELLANGPAITSATGVAREHRGRGVAAALKLASFRFLKERGYREARTHNDTENPPILRLNEKLGYHRLPGWLAWEKRIER